MIGISNLRKSLFVVPIMCLTATAGAQVAFAQSSGGNLVEQLQCQAGQACAAAKQANNGNSPFGQKRGLTPRGGAKPFGQKRSFEWFTEEDKSQAEGLANTGQLPSADVEILFDYDSAAIKPAAVGDIEQLRDAINHPSLAANRFMLVGHTDARGANDYNLELSQRRANAVRNFLISRYGIPPHRLHASGSGEAGLKNANDPFAAENRRVRIINVGQIVASGR